MFNQSHGKFNLWKTWQTIQITISHDDGANNIFPQSYIQKEERETKQQREMHSLPFSCTFMNAHKVLGNHFSITYAENNQNSKIPFKKTL